MKEQVTKRLEQLNAGKAIEKNDQVLEDVVAELKEEGLYVSGIKKKKSKKNKKAAEPVEEEEAPVAVPKKKKKKSTVDEE